MELCVSLVYFVNLVGSHHGLLESQRPKAKLENNIQLPTSCKIYIKSGNGQSGQ
jgi:hypothetical protein